ncbi:MAG: cupin domain-containing protein [Clostridia bacterium]|nr:cupin domain-containing protein [Clostridia bacterium]
MIKDLGSGVTREVLSCQDDLMFVRVSFETGSSGKTHSHHHAQNTYVLSGEFAFTVDGEERRVREGDTLAFLPNQPHGCACIHKGALLDAFSPAREDFLR